MYIKVTFVDGSSLVYFAKSWFNFFTRCYSDFPDYVVSYCSISRACALLHPDINYLD